MAKQLSNRITVSVCFIFCIVAWSSKALADETSYYEDAVEPILRHNCVACHHTKKAEGGLNLDSLDGLLRGGDSGVAVILREAKASLIMHRVTGHADTIMPPVGNKVDAHPLTVGEQRQLSNWIDGGMLARGRPAEGIDRPIQGVPEHLRTIYSLAVTADGDFLAYGRGNELIFESMQGRWGKSPVTEPSILPLVIRTPHRDFIYSMAFSPDGLRLATGSSHEVKLWRRVDIHRDDSIRRQTSSLPQNSRLITPSPDASKWVCVTEERLIHIFDSVPSTNESESETAVGSLRRLGSHPERIVAIAWSPSGEKLWSVDASGWLVAWHVGSTHSPDLNSTGPTATAMQLPRPITSLHALNDNVVIGIQSDEHVVAWELGQPERVDGSDQPKRSTWQWTDVSRGPLLEALNAKAPIQTLAVSKDGTLIAYRSALHSIELWNTQDVKPIGELGIDRLKRMQHARSERNVSRQALNLERLTASLDSLEKLVENENKSAEAARIAHESAAADLMQKSVVVQQAAVAVNEQEQAVAQARSALETATERLNQVSRELENKKKSIVDSEQKAAVAKTKLDGAGQALAAAEESQRTASEAVTARKQLIEQEQQVLVTLRAQEEESKTLTASDGTSKMSICFTQDSSHVLCLKDSQTIEAFSTQSLEGMTLPLVNEGDTTSILTLPNNRFASVGKNEQVQSWLIQPTWEVERIISNDGQSDIEERVTALAFSPDGTKLAIGSGIASRNGCVVICDSQDGKVTNRFANLHTDVVLGLAYSPEGRTLASCGADRVTKLIDSQSGKIQRTLEGHTHHILGIAWHDEAAKLASASADGTIKIWDIESGEARRTINVGRELSALAFIGESKQLLSASNDRLIRMHDIDSGNSLRQFGSASDAIYAMAVSPDVRIVIGGGQDGTVRLWQIEDAKLVLEIKP